MSGWVPAAAVLALAACACDPNAFKAEVKGETVIDGDPSGVAPLSALPPIGSLSNIDFNQAHELKSHGAAKDKLQSVKLDAAQVKILSPAEQDFGFLDSIQFYAKAGDQEVLIAEKSGIPELNLAAPNPVLKLDVKSEELLPFIQASSTSFIARGKGRKPKSATRLEATLTLWIQVKAF